MAYSEHLKFKHPFTACVAGPTSSGKTSFVFKFISHYKLTTSISKPTLNVLWCYGTWQNSYKSFENINIEYYEGLPDISTIQAYEPDLIVLDDLMFDIAKDENAAKLFTMYSHHQGISVIFITQNLTYKGKGIIEINRNTMYLVLFRNPRDTSMVNTVANQVLRSNKRHFREAFDDATKEPYGYLVVDCHQTTPSEFLLKSKIIPDNGRTQSTVYFEKKTDIQKFKALYTSS